MTSFPLVLHFQLSFHKILHVVGVESSYRDVAESEPHIVSVTGWIKAVLWDRRSRVTQWQVSSSSLKEKTGDPSLGKCTYGFPPSQAREHTEYRM